MSKHEQGPMPIGPQVEVPAPVAISGVACFPYDNDHVLFQVLNPEAMPIVEWNLTLEQAGQYAVQIAALVDAMLQRRAQVAQLVSPTGAILKGGGDGKPN